MEIPFTTRDVCVVLEVGPRRVQQLEQAGVLVAVRTRSGQRLFDPEHVEAVRQQRERAKLAKGRRP